MYIFYCIVFYLILYIFALGYCFSCIEFYSVHKLAIRQRALAYQDKGGKRKKVSYLATRVWSLDGQGNQNEQIIITSQRQFLNQTLMLSSNNNNNKISFAF